METQVQNYIKITSEQRQNVVISKVTKLSDSNKYQNVDKAKLLEQIDDSIQELNILKNKIRKMDDNCKVEIDHHTKNIELKNLLEAKNLPKLTEQELKDIEKETEKNSLLSDDNWKDNSKSVIASSKITRQYRQYELAFDRVKLFYKEQHKNQTVAYNIQARINFKTKIRDRMTVWDALIKLNNLLDESDPDTELSQIDHALQTAEAIRKDCKPRWFQLVGLIHDLGKLLYFFDSKGQWDVVGDTFPVGCRFSKKIIYYDYFKDNTDTKNPLYSTKYGIYSQHCGLDNVMLSWGHDEYMYHLAKEQTTLPPEGLAMIRYHSFYPWHSEGAYKYLMNEKDKEMLECVQAFNPYDLYSKTDIKYDIAELKPYYCDLIDEFFPNKIVEF